MEELSYKFIEQKIGYKFSNRLLLEQAFTRKSYSDEHGGENNEVLEFLGDRVLDLAIADELLYLFGNRNKFDFLSTKKFQEPYFECIYREGELTDLKKELVKTETLAAIIDELGFMDFEKLGDCDKNNNVDESNKVKADLFEAILGAAYLDSDSDYHRVRCIVYKMMNLSDRLLKYKELTDKYYFKFKRYINEHQLQEKIKYYQLEKNGYKSGYECRLEIVNSDKV